MSRFPTTAWKLIDAVGRKNHNDSFSAETNRFIATYWKPVFRFLRIRGLPAESAEDLTQSFFLRLLEKGWVSRADAERGRFRTFLLRVLQRFVADQGANRAPRQLAFESDMVSISALVTDEERQFEPPTGVTPEKLFMQEWARAVIDASCRQLRLWCDDQGRPDWYCVFEATIHPTDGRNRVGQREAAEQLGLSRDQVRTAQNAVKQQFIRLFRAEVAGQVMDPAEIDIEIRELESYLQI